MNSLAADQYEPVPSGKYCIVNVNELTCYFQELTHRSMLHNYVCIHTGLGTQSNMHFMHSRTHTHALTLTKQNHTSLLRVWYCEGREVCWAEKMAAFVCNNCCSVAAACANRTYLFHQWDAPRISFIQYMYLTGIIRSKKDLGPDIERMQTDKYAFTNFHTIIGICLRGWLITVYAPWCMIYRIQDLRV